MLSSLSTRPRKALLEKESWPTNASLPLNPTRCSVDPVSQLFTEASRQRFNEHTQHVRIWYNNAHNWRPGSFYNRVGRWRGRTPKAQTKSKLKTSISFEWHNGNIMACRANTPITSTPHGLPRTGGLLTFTRGLSCITAAHTPSTGDLADSFSTQRYVWGQ